jgi:hypothetical protein
LKRVGKPIDSLLWPGMIGTSHWTRVNDQWLAGCCKKMRVYEESLMQTALASMSRCD